ncbi:MAG: FAD-binding oxidoreductase [Actinomycetota bacterium]
MHDPPALPELRPADAAATRQLVELLGDDRVELDERVRREASLDHAWMSPVLTEDLPDVVADVVVRPGDRDDVAAVLDLAHRFGIAVTARGKGTGNYGQAVPLAAGIVLDLTDLRTVHDVGDDAIHADAGASFTRLEASARATGRQLRVFPSTVGSTLGGFLSGGAGGTGSIAHGFLWDGGIVEELTVLPCVEAPSPVVLDAEAAAPHVHAYGTTGVLTAARVAVEPAVEWTAVFAGFPTVTDAGEAAMRLATGLRTTPRNLAIDDAKLATVLAPAHPAIRPGTVGLRAIVAADEAGLAEQVVIGAGGTVGAVDPDGVGACVSLSYNHVTLRAKRLDPGICHLQISGRAIVERPDDVAAALPCGMVHTGVDGRAGGLEFGGLHLSRYEGRERLADGMVALRELGVEVVSPHSWRLGGHGPMDATVAAAVVFDPAGLLNPGKLPR